MQAYRDSCPLRCSQRGLRLVAHCGGAGTRMREGRQRGSAGGKLQELAAWEVYVALMNAVVTSETD